MDGPTTLLVAALTSAITAAATIYVGERYGLLPARTAAIDTVAPDMQGMSESEARSNANSAHVALFVASREPNLDVKPGAVVRQSVAAGHHVPLESSIGVVLADEIVRVPGVVGVPLAEAVQRLEQRGYSVQIAGTMADAKAPEGVIVSQLPKADVAYAKAGIVVLQTAGPSEVELPKLLGMGVTAAKAKIEELGLKPVIRWVAMAETPTNVVLNQDPAPGQKVKPGSTVQVTVCTP